MPKRKKLPKHHIDTCIILEKRTTENGGYCKKYLNLVGYKYRGILSLPVLGELMHNMLMSKKISDRYDMIDLLTSLINEKKIRFCSPKGITDTLKRLHEVDERIEPADQLIVAYAVLDKAYILVTIDSDLVENKKLEKEFGLKIIHPKDLI